MTKTKTTVKTQPKKVVKRIPKKEELDQTNKAVVTQKVISHRVLKYRYPRDCKEVLKRKAFRQTVRNKIRSLEREINKLKGEDRRNFKTELEAYMKTRLM